MRLVAQKKESVEEEFSKEQLVVNYIKSMLALEQAMEPFKEQKKELRSEYIEQECLTKNEIWSAVKTYRIYEKRADRDQLNDMFEAVEKQFGVKNEF